ncbi:MAG TPA: hypothetical protein VMV51_04710 [Gemmatimonadaceae bacterium]|nr:hypothetical protein [Gemmatimonadaceae bacterium]
MQDERFEPELQQAARAYHDPPQLDALTREQMWLDIEARQFDTPAPRRRPWVQPWLGIAAAIVVGIGIGRFTPLDGLLHPQPTARRGAVAQTQPPVPSVYEPTTSHYLDQTTALLAALPTEMHAGRANQQFIGRAANLLLTTRLLLDSPAAQDVKLRGLLDDLEVVLAQIVRLQAKQNTTELDLINQALEQRDVMPRLRTAAADISAD